jgi:hypothetical protein
MAKLANLSQLKAAGGFVPREPLKREVSWTHVDEAGEEVTHTFDIFIPRSNLSTALENRPEHVEAVTWELSRSLMLANDKGDPVPVSYEDVQMLEPTLATAIMKVIQEARTPKNSRPPTSSSAISSPVESAATP